MYKYTIDQVYLFFEKCKKQNLEDHRLHALSYANSIIYASPRFSDERKYAYKRQNMWNNFIDSLTWDSIEKKAKKTIGDFKKMFSSAGIMIKGKGKKVKS